MVAPDEPSPPGSIPQYIVDGLDRQGAASLHDIAEFAEELAAARNRPDRVEIESELPDDAELEGPDGDGSWVYKKMIQCGKDNCHCATGDRHGPYLYRYFYGDRGELTSEHIRKAIE